MLGHGKAENRDFTMSLDMLVTLRMRKVKLLLGKYVHMNGQMSAAF